MDIAIDNRSKKKRQSQTSLPSFVHGREKRRSNFPSAFGMAAQGYRQAKGGQNQVAGTSLAQPSLMKKSFVK
jgi:hypothetical protein